MLRKDIGTSLWMNPARTSLRLVPTLEGCDSPGYLLAFHVSQKQLDSALEGLSGVTGIADDTFVFGSTE